MTINCRWEHPEKKRYYSIYLKKDLFGQWVITRVWGGVDQATGRITHLLCETYPDALRQIQQIAITRIRRGYQCKTPQILLEIDKV